MDALLALSAVLVALFFLAAISLTFGVDSREGFGDERQHTTFG